MYSQRVYIQTSSTLYWRRGRNDRPEGNVRAERAPVLRARAVFGVSTAFRERDNNFDAVHDAHRNEQSRRPAGTMVLRRTMRTFRHNVAYCLCSNY
jgi:hypothetical protein